MYKIVFTSQGMDSLQSLTKNVSQRILDKLGWLIRNAGSINHLPLKSNLSGFYKLRVGDWRVLYEIAHDEKLVTVHKIGHKDTVIRTLLIANPPPATWIRESPSPILTHHYTD